MAAAAIIATLTGAFVQRGFVKPQVPNKALNPNLSNPDNDVNSSKTGVIFLPLDAMLSENPDFPATPTISEVEDGAEISDHVTLKPIKLSIRGIVTDTPVSLVRALSSPFQSPSPSQAAFIFLRKLRDDRLPFDFVGGLTVYKSMIITDFNPVRNAETGDSLQFTCNMSQVKVVSSQTIPISKIAKASQKSASPKQSQGNQVLSNPSAFQTQIHDSFQSVTPTAGTL